jgi:hypothetical protein
MDRPITKRTRKYQVDEGANLDGSKAMTCALHEKEWFQKLNTDDQEKCRQEFKDNFEYDFVDRKSFVIPNTVHAQQIVMKWLRKAGF